MAFITTMPDDFTKADGTKFRSPKRDAENALVLRKDEDGNILSGADGTPLIEMEDVGFLLIIRSFLNGIFRVAEQKKTLAMQTKKDIKPELDLQMEDSAYAMDIFRALNVATDGCIILEKKSHEWLLKQFDIWAVDLYGVDGAIIKEPFQQASEAEMTRAEQHRDKHRNGKEEKVAAEVEVA
jgi:hypothetical protein